MSCTAGNFTHARHKKCWMLFFFPLAFSPLAFSPTVCKRHLLAEKSLEDMHVQEFGKTLSIAITIKILFVLMCHSIHALNIVSLQSSDFAINILTMAANFFILVWKYDKCCHYLLKLFLLC